MESKAGDEVRVRLADGTDIAGKVLSKLEAKPGKLNDLALIQLEGERKWPSVELGSVAGLRDDDLLVAVGYPRTSLFTRVDEQPPRYVRLGRRHPPGPAPPRDGELITTIRGHSGDSGGPLFDLAGRLIGVVAQNDGSGTRCSYTTADVVRAEWPELAPGRAALEVGDAARPKTVSPAEATATAVAAIRGAVVEVQSRERWVALGVVVGEGLVITKASELGPELTVVLPNDVPAHAELAAVDADTDLALLKLPAADLTRGIGPIRWAGGGEPLPGAVVAAVTPAEFTPPVGVVCGNARAVPRVAGVLPIEVRNADGGVEITRVVPELFGLWLRQPEFTLQVGDIITTVAGARVANADAYEKLFEGESIGSRPRIAGEPIRLTYQRGGKSASVMVRMCPDRTLAHQLVRPSSYRYTGFSNALITDMPTRPEQCGAPVVDAEGRLVGVFIARAMFIESLVLPANEVSAAIERLRALAVRRSRR
jgi:serine protease Do